MKDSEARADIRQLKKGLGKLCHLLGVSYDESWGKITIDEYSMIHGGNPKLRPVTSEQINEKFEASGELHRRRLEELNLILDYFGLEIRDGKHLVKIKKQKK